MEKRKENEEEALQSLSDIHFRILWVDLTNDKYEIIKAKDYEIDNYPEKISESLNQFAYSEQVYADDREKYLNFADPDYLRQSLRDGETYMCCHYRRKVKDEYRWVSMELVPSRE